MQLIDSHCHIDNEKYTETPEEIAIKAKSHGVKAMINVGYDLNSSKNAVKLSVKIPQLYSAVGIHPHDAKKAPTGYLNQLAELTKNQKVVALGEIGLDYHYNFSSPEIQKKVFKEQLQLAYDLDIPFIIHQREAVGDMLEIIKRFPKPPQKAVFHCFSGSSELAKELITMGYYISVGGPVTFKNAKKPKQVAKDISLENLLVETDCPYLTPHPFRGKTNYPHYVKYVVEEIAAIKGISKEEVASKTLENTEQLFGMKVNSL
ncbi:TatD family hydrolase [Proteinivorax hydrogeniformans]|uniref:TatD family hydrolase n=1 Tax=Proteinivorax hydrogeniformans TaxID=1826727 RepID=A0AAU8HT69_9FIRM